MSEINEIRSKDNARLAFARKVRDGKEPAYIFLEGVRLAGEALRSGIELAQCLVSADLLASARSRPLLIALAEADAAINSVSAQLFDRLVDTSNSQGIIVIAKRPDSGAFAIEPAAPAELFIFLSEINDPSNLGAVLRTAEAAGCNGVLISERSADAFSPKALRAGMGANLRIRIWEGASEAASLEWARGRGLKVLAADIKGRSEHTSLDLRSSALIIFGSEAHGLSNGMLEAADETFRIAMKNDVESLNLAVSAGIVLFEAVRQRGPGSS